MGRDESMAPPCRTSPIPGLYAERRYPPRPRGEPRPEAGGRVGGGDGIRSAGGALKWKNRSLDGPRGRRPRLSNRSSYARCSASNLSWTAAAHHLSASSADSSSVDDNPSGVGLRASAKHLVASPCWGSCTELDDPSSSARCTSRIAMKPMDGRANRRRGAPRLPRPARPNVAPQSSRIHANNGFCVWGSSISRVSQSHLKLRHTRQ